MNFNFYGRQKLMYQIGICELLKVGVSSVIINVGFPLWVLRRAYVFQRNRQFKETDNSNFWKPHLQSLKINSLGNPTTNSTSHVAPQVVTKEFYSTVIIRTEHKRLWIYNSARMKKSRYQKWLILNICWAAIQEGTLTAWKPAREYSNFTQSLSIP